MFKEKVNARTDGRTTDNGPWHKLAGLRPVELKMNCGERKQEGHDGSVSLHWLTIGNLFKT